MNEFEQMLAKSLSDSVNEQYAEFFAIEKKHRFSRGYKRQRRKNILSAEKTRGGMPIPPAPSFSLPRMAGIPFKKRIAIISIAVIMAVGASGGAGASLAVGMRRVSQRQKSFTLAVVDDSNSPTAIEYVYYLPEIPEGYYLYEYEINPLFDVDYWYKNYNGYDFIGFTQSRRGDWASYDNEHILSYEDVMVGDKFGVFMTWEKTTRLVWDNGDYVLEISSRLPKEEVINLAKSAKVCENLDFNEKTMS